MAGNPLRRLFAEQNGLCYYCGTQTDLVGVTGPKATVDHKLPRSRGGRGFFGNKVMACDPCNNRKGSMTEEEFRAVLAEKR